MDTSEINEYFDPDIDFGIKQYVADYQAVYLTFDIETSLMWQSGIVAKWRLSENRAKLACAMPSVSQFDDVRVALSKKEKSATSLGDCGRGEINKFLFRLRVGRDPCNS